MKYLGYYWSYNSIVDFGNIIKTNEVKVDYILLLFYKMSFFLRREKLHFYVVKMRIWYFDLKGNYDGWLFDFEKSLRLFIEVGFSPNGWVFENKIWY